MNLKSIIFILLVFSTFAGCGGRSNKGAPSSAVTNYPSLEELQAALDKQTVLCGEDNEVCPGFSAKLTFWGKSNKDEYYLGVCSGSLYENKYIITNSHCVPEELKGGRGDCGNQLKVLFPRTHLYPYQSARCARVIQAYKQKQGEPDIAVLELDRTLARESVALAPNAFVENSRVMAYTMDPSEYDNHTGTIYKKSCTLSIDNMYTMSQNARVKEAIVYGSNCNLINGNSGSALLNQNGQMIAVVFARLVQESLDNLFKKLNIHSKGMFPMGVAQNIGCIKDVASNGGIGCDIRSPTVGDLESAIERSVEEQSLKGISPAQIEYAITSGFELLLKQVPYAFPGKSLEDFKKNWETAITSQGTSQSVLLKEEL